MTPEEFQIKNNLEQLTIAELALMIKYYNIPISNLHNQLSLLANKIYTRKVSHMIGPEWSEAVLRNNLVQVRNLLKSNYDINAPVQDDMTAVEFAIFNDNITLLRLLLEYNPNIDSTRAFKYFYQGKPNCKLLAVLLNANINVNCEGLSPLTEAMSRDQQRLVVMLLDAGAKRKLEPCFTK